MASSRSLFCISASALLTILHAQPTAYTVSAINSMIGPEVSTTIYRDGSKAVVDNASSHARTLYDLSSHTTYSWDVSNAANGCSNGNFSGDWGDPFEGVAENLGKLAKQHPAEARTETINGIATRILEAPFGGGKVKAWVDPRSGQMIRLQMTPEDGKMRPMLEVNKVTLGAPAASVFALPASCQATAAVRARCCSVW